jgi:cytochrome c556
MAIQDRTTEIADAMAYIAAPDWHAARGINRCAGAFTGGLYGAVRRAARSKTSPKEKWMKLKALAAGAVLALGSWTAIEAIAQQNPADNLVRQRQGVMLLQGKYFGPLAGMAAGKVPYDATIATRNAGFLDSLSQMPWDAFTPETQSATVKTRALPEIFKDQAGFKAAQDQLRGAVQKLNADAKNEGSFKAAAGDVGKACNGCHDKFRSK